MKRRAGERRRLAGILLLGLVLSACGFTNNGRTSDGRIIAVGAESQYANVISQVGGRYVDASGILSNPSTDPHSFEASPSIARRVAGAGLVVQNGLGYDEFMQQLEKATPSSARHVIDVQTLLKKPDATPNPHLWYDPTTMPVVAQAIADELSQIAPEHQAYFQQNAATFKAALARWSEALAELKQAFPAAAVATTEPVADYLIDAAGLHNLTPWSFQDAVMKGSDPSPQDVARLQNLFKNRQVKVFIYNVQIVDSLTQSFADLAKNNGIPVVGVYETMSAGYDYQSWMIAQTKAIQTALTTGRSVTL